VLLDGACAPPTRCLENSLVDTTATPFVCTCRAGVTIRYLNADGDKCVDSCFAAAESREMGYDVYYPFKEAGREYQCAETRRPEPGWKCEYYPTPRVKRFDGSCVPVEDGCNAAGAIIDEGTVQLTYP